MAPMRSLDAASMPYSLGITASARRRAVAYTGRRTSGGRRSELWMASYLAES